MNTLFIKNAVAYVTLMFLFSFFLISCSSSGDGGGIEAPAEPAGLTYTGLTSAATITDTNAPLFAANITKGQTGGTLPVALGAVTKEPESDQGPPFGYLLSKVLRDIFSQMDFSVVENTVFMGAELEEPITDTVAGSCGGESEITITEYDEPYDFRGTIVFRSFCEHGIILNGNGVISGEIDIPGQGAQPIWMIDFSSPNLNATIEGISYTIDGRFVADYLSNGVSLSEYTLYFDYLFQEDSTGDVYWCRDFNLDGPQESEYVIIEFNIVSGKFYDPAYGYVDVTTPTPLTIQDGDDYPESGEMLMEGADGAACPTAAQLTAISSTECQVVADTDGDCNFDDYDSGVINWMDL